MELLRMKLLIICLTFSLSSCGDQITQEMEMEMEMEEEIPVANVLEPNGGCPDTLSPIYFEKDGLLLIETESADFLPTSWKLDSIISGASNNKYLVWRGPDHFNAPGNGTLTYNIRITNPGTYRFVWKSRITEGDSNTDFNDSWLRIPNASHFYAQKENGHIVYPKGTDLPPIPESAGQSDTKPEGSSSKGWFKVYMNTKNQWRWRSTTSDNDPHQIYAVFNEAGDYVVQISGRSKSHGIDKFTLFLESYGFENATTHPDLSQAECE